MNALCPSCSLGMLIHVHRWMAILFGVAFTAFAFLTSEISIADEFTNKVGPNPVQGLRVIKTSTMSCAMGWIQEGY